MSPTPRLLILTSSTGSGHNARAHALKAWIQQLCPQAKVLIHKTLENTHPLYAFGVALYNRIQRHAPILHHLYFHALEILRLHKHPTAILGRSRFTKLIEHFQPHLVISVHAHTNHGYFHLIRSANIHPTPPCITYCGELTGGYGFSHLWVNPQADLFIGATTETCQAAIHLGMPKNKTLSGGFLLDPRFYQPPLALRSTLLQSLGLDPHRPTLLIPSTGNGANHHLKILQALSPYPHPLQLLFLCGNNTHLITHLNTLSTPHKKILALPHSNDMPTLLRSVDAVITRPGSATTSEAILCQCPIIHHALGGLMPQESLNVRYALRHNLSLYAPRSRHLRALFQRLSHDLSALHNLKKSHPIPSHPTTLLAHLLQHLPKHHRPPNTTC